MGQDFKRTFINIHGFKKMGIMCGQKRNQNKEIEAIRKETNVNS